MRLQAITDCQKFDGRDKRAQFRGTLASDLKADHSAEFVDLPSFALSGELSNCTYNGTGTWNWEDIDGSGVRLILSVRELTLGLAGKPVCGSHTLALFELLGHSAPYRIWYGIGDPDEEMGLTYIRRDSVVTRK